MFPQPQRLLKQAEDLCRQHQLRAPRAARAPRGHLAALAALLPEALHHDELAPTLTGFARAAPPQALAPLRQAWGAPQAGAEAAVEALGALHEALRAAHRQGKRRNAGIFYTPGPLADWLARQALEGLEPEAAPLQVADPSCGCGALLLPLARRLLEQRQDALSGLHGLDIDPLAVEIARLRLWALAQGRGLGSEALAQALLRQVRVEDGLTGELPPLDVVISNPPFGNAIEAATARSAQQQARHRALLPEIARGAYDLSVLFAVRAAQRLRPGGRYGLVLPRSLLSVDSASHARSALWELAQPRIIWCPQDARLFQGADVFVALLVGQRGQPTQELRLGEQPPGPDGAPRGPLRLVRTRGEEPWAALLSPDRALLHRARAQWVPCTTLGEALVLHGGAATGVAYELKACLRDQAQGPGPRLITTGLIDPHRHLWGERGCRYLGRDHQHPRWPPAQEAPRGVRKAMERQRAPKVLVAGLSRTLEAVADPGGELAGVVSTWVVRAPAPFPGSAWLLEGLLCAPLLSLVYMTRFRGKQMSGGNTTVGQRELKTLPLPMSLAWLCEQGPDLLAPVPALDPAEIFKLRPQDTLELARQIAQALQRSVDQRPEPSATGRAYAAASRLYGLDAATHEAVGRWCQEKRRSRRGV